MTRRVLVTGCSSGIGLAVACRLAKDELKRFEVIATMRDLEKRGPLEEAAGDTLNQTLKIKQLDVCSEASIRECVNSLPDRRVDVLVNNAGVGLIGPLECQSISDMKKVFETNFFGIVRLVQELLPDMKRRKSGHIVVMSSVMGLQGLLFNDVYSASKFAVEGFCESLAPQARRFNIKVSLVEPGPVVTEFERKLYEDVEKMDLTGTDEETAIMFREIYIRNSKMVFVSISQTPEEIAEQTFQVITATDPPLRHQTNCLYMPLTALKHIDPTGQLSLNTFYKMTFTYDRIFIAFLGFLRVLRRQPKTKL